MLPPPAPRSDSLAVTVRTPRAQRCKLSVTGPRQLPNRVTPTGKIGHLPFRGRAMGNRGILHDPERRILRLWRLRAWLICRTRWKGRKSAPMPVAEAGYTRLFFLDEVSALAAGHRPCFECRHARAKAFLSAAGYARAAALDAALHGERLCGPSSKPVPRRHFARPSELPVGTMVQVGGTVFALWRKGFVAWTPDAPEAYASALTGEVADDANALVRALAADAPLTVLTPPTTRAALATGYRPTWHPSVRQAAVIAR